MKGIQKRVAFLGVDNTLKTTLAQELSTITDIPYFRDGIYKERYFNNSEYALHTADFFLQYLEQSGAPIISDRFFWDEMVYGPNFGRDVDHNMYFEFDRRAYKLGFKIIYCMHDNPEADDLIAAADRANLLMNYETVLFATKCQVIRIDTTKQNVEDLTLDILNKIA